MIPISIVGSWNLPEVVRSKVDSWATGPGSEVNPLGSSDSVRIWPKVQTANYDENPTLY